MKTLLRTLVCSFVVATTLVLPTSADAGLSDAAYPTLMRGARGHDVTALQYLLNFRGYPVTVDGVFGSSTDTQVRAFQTAKGLTSDGVVGPATWGQLKVTLQQGSTGDAVRAMEWLLNAKRDPDNPQWSTVTINGSFSASDKTVVQAFQNEVGLTADGIVGTNTWTRLLWHFRQLTNQGTLCLYPASRSSVDHAWLVGTGAGWTERAATLNYDHGGDGLIAFQDGSYEHGGDTPYHLSHERGLDLDIELVRDNSDQCTMPGGGGYTTRFQEAYDQAGTTRQIQYFLEAASQNAGDNRWIKLIYFNDPYVIGLYGPKVRSYSGHDDHFHVRFCVAYYPGDASYDC